MKREKFKLVCLNEDECGYVEYVSTTPEDYICTNCGNIAAFYEANSIPIHKKAEHVFELDSIKKLSLLRDLLLTPNVDKQNG